MREACCWAAHRFIPACAGNSQEGRFRTPCETGSSPRVRGTPAGGPAPLLDRRFIPACAGNSAGGGGERAHVAVHPRVCGELQLAALQLAVAFGSSPRVRGTRGRRRRLARRHRFIPACAGNSPDKTPPNAWLNGSSPRVRGTRLAGDGKVGLRRFIPACAGNSWSLRTWGSALPVHPRVCGELGFWSQCYDNQYGSSPRVRGTRQMKRPQIVSVRFIPACAGNSAQARLGHKNSNGSSPRVRGTLRREPMGCPPDRFIPACAGNSPRRPPPRGAWPVHPRVCGELRPRPHLGLCLTGSSPRVRGTRQSVCLSSIIFRFIPACAGNSKNASTSALLAFGSSPRVRGTLLPSQTPMDARRFIPACAGNSLGTETVRTKGFGSSPRVRGTRIRLGHRLVGRRFIPACAGNSAAVALAPARPTVHPRVCGELAETLDTSSSGVRFIPACAGNSFAWPSTRR